MEYLYCYPETSAKLLKNALAAFEEAGYNTDNIAVGTPWNEFINTLPNHQTVVVYSVDFCPSLVELLATLAELNKRNIILKSLQEPWLQQEINSTTDFLLKLKELALMLHQKRTKQGIKAAKERGTKIGRPAKTIH